MWAQQTYALRAREVVAKGDAMYTQLGTRLYAGVRRRRHDED
ncbi:MAG: hypothetical protein QW247_09455 [Pyrobaculum sp.]